MANGRIDQIIRHMRKGDAKHPDEELVYVDRKTGKTNVGMFAPRTKYFVKHDVEIEIYRKEASFQVFATKEYAEIGYRMTLKCEPGNESRLASALHRYEDKPSIVLDDLVRDKIRSLFKPSGNSDFSAVSQRIVCEKRAWEDTVASYIREKTGLKATFVFELPKGVVEKMLDHDLPKVEVTPRDAPSHTERADFHFQIQAIDKVDTSELKYRFPTQKSEKTDLLREIAKKCFRENVSIFEYWYRHDEVESKVQAAATSELRPYGVMLNQLSISRATPPVGEETPHHTDVKWDGNLGRQVLFRLEAALAMSAPDGAARYIAAGRPDRDKWFKAVANDAVTRGMNGKDFMDLLTEEWSAINQKIHNIMKASATEIGHVVKAPFVASPSIPEREWLSDRPVEIKADEAIYAAGSGLDPVKMAVGFSIRFSSLRRLLDAMHAKQHSIGDRSNSEIRPDISSAAGVTKFIEQEIKDFAVAALQQDMRAVEPQDYYENFSQVTRLYDDGRAGSEETKEPLKTRLEAKLKAALEEQFDAVILKIGISQEDTQIKEINDEIAKLGELVVSIMPLPYGADKETQRREVQIVFRASMSIASGALTKLMRNRDEFLQKNVIASRLEEWATEFFEERDSNEFRDMKHSGENLTGVKSKVSSYVNRHSPSACGLDFHCLSIDFQSSPEERIRLKGNALQQLEFEANTKQFENLLAAQGELYDKDALLEGRGLMISMRTKLYDRKKELLQGSGPEGRREILFINSEIEKIEEHIGESERRLGQSKVDFVSTIQSNVSIRAAIADSSEGNANEAEPESDEDLEPSKNVSGAPDNNDDLC
jgi:hypothetical protein